jgi:hypothetical protein
MAETLHNNTVELEEGYAEFTVREKGNNWPVTKRSYLSVLMNILKVPRLIYGNLT